MPDRLIDPTAGPDSMLSDQLPPSRGQLHTIAVLALGLLGVAPPQHRLDASIAIVRLRTARDDTANDRPHVPAVDPF
jgi:hypothetical protein